jgi:prevent-host-death family protein
MSHLVSLYEAKTHLSALVDQVSEHGEEVVIAKNGVPLAKLVRFAARKLRKPGGWKGKVWEAPDAFAPLSSAALETFYGGNLFPAEKSQTKTPTRGVRRAKTGTKRT